MGGSKQGDERLEALQAENAELKKKLGEKVWTMTLAAVAGMEKMTMEGATGMDKATIPYRIASLERAVFGSSASEDDLSKIASLEADYMKLQQDYESLADMYQELKDQPPQVVESSESVKLLEEQLRKMQERYQTMQQKLSKLRVDHLDLETNYKQLQEEHEKVKLEAEQKSKNQGGQVGRLKKEHEKLAQNLQQVRSAYAEAQSQLAALKQENAKLQEELQAVRASNSEMARLKGEYQDLLAEFRQLQDDHEQLQDKSDRFRSTLNGAWGGDEGGDTNLLTLPPLTPTGRSPTSSMPVDKVRSLSKSEPKLSGLQETKEARFPTSLLEPAGPLSVGHLKTRIMEIKGRVLYCNDKWHEQRDEKLPEPPRRMTLAVYDAW
mmetsp:Transcript_6556/g.15164  ORF Transcript_6556/g.15164 Transcript_6556/m.15164 type:complete len:380 (+) Transcript_6556:48-1187(+)